MAVENITTMKEATELLASKHEEERRKILTSRMERVLEMPEEERIAAIRDMLGAEGELSEEDRVKVIGDDRSDPRVPVRLR